MKRLLCSLAPGLLAVGLLAGCGEDPTSAPDPDTRTGGSTTSPSSETPAPPTSGSTSPTRGPVQAQDLATDLNTPWGLAPLEDGRVLVGSRDTGEIRALDTADGTVSDPLRTIDVRAEGESGLLGMAMSPDESALFAYYTTENDSRVARMSWDGQTLGEPRVIVEGIPGGATFHQGGGLAVGPDGLLYASTGDNGVSENAQDPQSLSGKVLRYTLSGEPAPPEGTPFGGDSPVYSLGHRNVEGLAFDEQGRLWACEFGDDKFDELNLIEPGENYGWPEVEGTADGNEYVDPVAVWTPDEASPSGISYWRGSLWMAALAGETLWEIPLDGAEAGQVGQPIARLEGEYGRLRNVVPAPGGEALLLATSNTDGRGDPAPSDDRILRVTR